MPHHSLTFHSDVLLIPAVLFVLGAGLLFFIRRDTESLSLLIAGLSTYIVTLASILFGMLVVLLLHREPEDFWFWGLFAALLLPIAFAAMTVRYQRGRPGVAYGRKFAVAAALILLISGLFGSLYAFK